MSRPPISYPSPLVGTSNLVPVAPHTNPGYHSRPSLEPSPVSGPSERRPSHSSSRQVSGPSSRHGTGSLDSEITRLLVTTKQMLQGLEAWAVGNLDEDGVSDIYVKLGNGFEQCTTSFQRAGIATDELESIPSDLRLCLEQCLSEDPSQETLNVYLPNIRNIIVSLLNGLKQKQSAYKRLMTERQQSDTPLPIQPRALPRADLSTDSRLSARSGNSSMSQGSTSPASISSGLPIPRIPSSQALSERARQGLPSRPAPPDAFRPPRRIPEPPRRSVSPQPQPQPQSSPFIPHERVSSTSSSAQELPHLVRHQLTDNPVPPAGPQRQNSSTPPPAVPPKPAPPHPDRFSRDSFGNSRISRFSADSDVTNGSPIRSPTAQTPKSQKSPAKSLASLPEANEGTDQSRRSSEHSLPPTLPPLLPTLNLPSSSMLFPDPPGADLTTPVEAIPDVPPETRATLAALGRSDALERRASKRFSSYTFNKLPGSPSHKKAASVGSPQRPMRRVDRPPPLPSLPESLAGSNLAAAMNGEDVSRALTPPPRSDLLLPSADDRDHPSSSPASIMTDRSDGSTGSVRRVKTPEPAEPSAQATPRPVGGQSSASIPATQAAADSLSLFLQIGRQVKKATVELPISLSSLRLLFMERFEYDPGMEDFPDVYMRDTKTGVQFELEDMEDLKEGCVLSLNIEPLDQVKQHFDIAFNSMTQELKELKTALDHSRRISTSPNSAFLAVSPSSQAISRIPLVRTESSRPSSPSPRSNNAPLVGPQREAELRAQYDEVQSLRRDLAVMRQIHVDFLAETKEVFGKLRKENNGMRDLVKTKIGGSRALLDNSRIKLDSLSTETIQAVEEISDIIDAARLDASKRFVTPSRTQWASIRADFKKASEMVESFATEVTTSEPTWRATWHQELSRVMEEQRLLPHWTKLTEDLKNDIKDAEGMLQNLQDFVDQRTTAGGGQGQAGSGQSVTLRSTPKGFRPPSPDESGGGGINHLLMEIRTKEADPHQRLRAIEAQQKAREREKANKTDEFSEELAGFVQGRKLKKTGGTDETERQRQRRHEQTLKRMMNPAPEGSPGGGSGGKQGMLSPQITGMSTSSVGGGMGSASPVGRGSRQSSATVNPNSATAGSGRESRNSTTSSVDVKPEVKVDVKEE